MLLNKDEPECRSEIKLVKRQQKNSEVVFIDIDQRYTCEGNQSNVKVNCSGIQQKRLLNTIEIKHLNIYKRNNFRVKNTV